MRQKILLLSLLLLLVAYKPVDVGVAETAVATGKAGQMQAGDIVFAEGRVEPLFFTEMAFQSDGAVAAILVEEGDAVQEGAPLIRLDAIEAELALQQAQQQLAKAEAGLSVARAKLRMAQADRSTAQGHGI